MKRKKLQRLLAGRLRKKNFAKKLLKEMEILKQWLMKKYKITNEEEYAIRDDIYRENKANEDKCIK